MSKKLLRVAEAEGFLAPAVAMETWVKQLPSTHGYQDTVNITFAYLDGIQRYIDDITGHMIDKGMRRVKS